MKQENASYVVKDSYEGSYRRNYNNYGRNSYTHKFTDEEEPIPYSAAFRIRVIVCVMLFLFFVFAKYNQMLPEEKVEVLYQALDGPASMENIETCLSLLR